jgi:hypothetical protein
MTNPYGITLDSAWTEWAAKEEVSETVAAALLLICETRPVHEVVAKLTPREFERVVDIVRRSPDHFPSGTLAALKGRSPMPARRPQSDSVFREHMRASAELGPHTKQLGLAEQTNRAGSLKWEAKDTGGSNAEKAGTHTGTLAAILRRRMVVEDLRGLGLSIRGIAAATGIPRSSVHRAVRSIARARAKQEADTIEIMKKLLGKKLSRQGEHSHG